MNFQSSPKKYKNYKSRKPEETIKEAQNFFKRLNINVEYFEQRIENKDFRSYSGTLKTKGFYFSAGKGVTKNLCKASAYAEAVERTLSHYSPQIRFKRERIKNFQKGVSKRLSVREIVPFFNFKNEKGDEDFMRWIEGESFLQNKKKSLPHDFIEDVCTSNGLASGNTLEEAVTQGFCEVFERYSRLEHVAKKIEANTIDQRTIKNKVIHKFIKLFNSLNIDVKIKDMTLEGRVPVMGVLFTNNNVKEANEIIKNVFYKELAVGAAPDLELAIIRCFTEMIQTRLSDKKSFTNPGEFVNQVGEFEQRINFFGKYYNENDIKKIISNLKRTKRYLDVKDGKSLDDFNYFERGEIVPFFSLKSFKSKDFLDDVNIVKDILRENGWDAYIIDYSIEECFIKVVRVVVPSVSDILRFIFENGDVFERPESIYYLTKDLINFEERGAGLLGAKRFNFLKYECLPYLLIPWISHPIERSAKDIIKEMLSVSKNKELKREYKKIREITDQLFLFD